jgi:hypothetical protein
MLTDQQVNFLTHISAMAHFGVIAGAVCGLITGALIRLLRTRSFCELMMGVVFGLVPGAISSGIAAIAIGIIDSLVFEIGPKGGYIVPNWVIGPICFTILLTSALTVILLIPTSNTVHSAQGSFSLKLLFWTLLGGLLGLIAELAPGFDGYFCLGNNGRLVLWATKGLLFGCCVTSFWRIVMELLIKKNCAGLIQAEQNKESCEWFQE